MDSILTFLNNNLAGILIGVISSLVFAIVANTFNLSTKKIKKYFDETKSKKENKIELLVKFVEFRNLEKTIIQILSTSVIVLTIFLSMIVLTLYWNKDIASEDYILAVTILIYITSATIMYFFISLLLKGVNLMKAEARIINKKAEQLKEEEEEEKVV